MAVLFEWKYYDGILDLKDFSLSRETYQFTDLKKKIDPKKWLQGHKFDSGKSSPTS